MAKGLLGSHSPQALVDTMVVLNRLYFALSSGSEYRQLQLHPCQIQLIESVDNDPTSSILKTFPKTDKVASKEER